MFEEKIRRLRRQILDLQAQQLVVLDGLFDLLKEAGAEHHPRVKVLLRLFGVGPRETPGNKGVPRPHHGKPHAYVAKLVKAALPELPKEFTARQALDAVKRRSPELAEELKYNSVCVVLRRLAGRKRLVILQGEAADESDLFRQPTAVTTNK